MIGIKIWTRLRQVDIMRGGGEIGVMFLRLGLGDQHINCTTLQKTGKCENAVACQTGGALAGEKRVGNRAGRKINDVRQRRGHRLFDIPKSNIVNQPHSPQMHGTKQSSLGGYGLGWLQIHRVTQLQIINAGKS